MHQILTSALKNPTNKTKFTLIFANQSPKDVLLKEEFDELKKKYPETFEVVYTVDKADKDWKGNVLFFLTSLLSFCLFFPLFFLGGLASIRRTSGRLPQEVPRF